MNVNVSFSRCSLYQIIRQWNQTVKYLHLASVQCKDVKLAKSLPSATKKQSKSAELEVAALAVDGQHVATPKSIFKEAKKNKKKIQESIPLSISPATYHCSSVDRSLILPVGLLEHLSATRKKFKKISEESENTSIQENFTESVPAEEATKKTKIRKSPKTESTLVESISEPSSIAKESKKKSTDSGKTLVSEDITKPKVEDASSSTANELVAPTVEEIPFFTQKNGVILPFPFIIRDKILKEEADHPIMTIPRIQQSVPTISQVLNDTKPESSIFALAIWRKRLIAEVGEEKFNQLQQETRTTGKNMHTCIETFLRGVDYNQVLVDPRIAGHWLSLSSILKSVQNARALESFVLHPHLKYKGVFDCVASYNGNLVLIDWKTSQRRKNTAESTYDDPVQIAAYVGAVNADENYPFTIENALLVIAYPTGMPADVIQLNRQQLEAYWLIWLRRLQEFYRRKSAAAKQQQN